MKKIWREHTQCYSFIRSYPQILSVMSLIQFQTDKLLNKQKKKIEFI